MSDIAEAALLAFRLLFAQDPELFRIIRLSLGVSLAATVAGGVAGIPLGAVLAVTSFAGRGIILVVANALLGLPPVVVGLVVYLLLSRAGPLGSFGILFTPSAMVVAQAILVAPIWTVLVQRAIAEPWAQYGDALRADGASRLRAMPELLRMNPAGLLTAFLAGFGRAIAEVGAILIVGGNIAGVTRTMTTTIVLETSKGNLPLALGLGIILVAISVGVSALAFGLARQGARA